MDLSPKLNAATKLAREAGKLIMEIYQTDFSVTYKGPSDPVTQADKQANSLIVQGLQQEFPQDLIVAEESPCPDGLTSKGHIWFVDPLDGTKEFINKNGEFSVMIGLAIDGHATLGVVYRPDLDLLYSGIADRGAWLETPDSRTTLNTSATTTPELLTLTVSRSHRNPQLDTIKERLGIQQELPSGSVGLKIGHIATCRADVYIEPGPFTSAWDACGPEAILRGAGGQFTDIFGNSILYGHDTLKNTKGLVATNGPIHENIIHTLSSMADQIHS